MYPYLICLNLMHNNKYGKKYKIKGVKPVTKPASWSENISKNWELKTATKLEAIKRNPKKIRSIKAIYFHDFLELILSFPNIKTGKNKDNPITAEWWKKYDGIAKIQNFEQDFL